MSDPTADPVTFLFTDIEGSTRLWEERPEAMRLALARHDALLRACLERCGGEVFKTVGDAFCAAFADPKDAAAAAVAAQRALAALRVGAGDDAPALRIRVALHTGVAERRDGDYFGPPLNRIARLLAIGHGGQTLLSAASEERLRGDLPPDVSLREMGLHRLKDLELPEVVFQLCHPDLPADFPALRSLQAPERPHNLPRQTTRFVGRETERAQVCALFDRAALVTLTGVGGTGKTRLALEAATDLRDGVEDGVWLVELAALTDPALVPQAVAGVLGLKEEAGRTLQQTLVDRLKTKRMLLVLDNCEHLLESCARLVDATLQGCPGVRVLATSREGLGIAGETTYRVPSLSLPDPARDRTPEAVEGSEAVRLFLDRAAQVQPDFAATAGNASTLASVCRRLDGIPLAIELAAARLRSLSLDEIHDRLDQRFRLLTGGSRTALPRQQTLRSLVDWSYDLLDDSEKALLCRLSVFAGGWTLEAAEQVASGDGVEEWETLDLLTSLVDKSLLLAEERAGKTRYRLLETVRQYAREKLEEGGGAASARRRHGAHFLDLAEAAGSQLTGAAQADWLGCLEREHENLRAALEWSLAEPDETALRMCGALWRFWMVRGHLTEGRRWCHLALEKPDGGARGAARAKALNGAGTLATYQGDFAASRLHHEESLALRRALGDRQGCAASLNNLGLVSKSQGDFAAAQRYHEEGLILQREIGDRWGVAASCNNLGNVAQAQGDFAAAHRHHEESLALFREIGDPRGIAASLNSLGNVLKAQGDFAAARPRFEESLALQREIGDRWGVAASCSNLGEVVQEQGDLAAAGEYFAQSCTLFHEIGERWGVTVALRTLAALAAERGRPEPAARLWGAAEALREEIGAPLSPPEQERHDRQVEAARRTTDPEAFGRAWAEGRALGLEAAVALALSEATAA